MKLTKKMVKKLADVARTNQIPPIPPNDKCPEPHYELRHKSPYDWITVGLDGREWRRGRDYSG